jgi:tRNA 2-thiouridine synthesizing protein A
VVERRDKAAICSGMKSHHMKRSALDTVPCMTTTSLNLRGLKCPLPALRVRKALKGAEPGMLFVVECTDPMAAIDIPNLVRETGDAIEQSSSEGDLLIFHIRKAA